ncbi:MAG: SAM-dependent methyltransferase [Candidatus Gastranaerophilales bacterium]|nr:SAM-dependent methyltransferase [Candidatus Gastranaerophilales bacterium]
MLKTMSLTKNISKSPTNDKIFLKYNLDDYIKDVEKNGLEKTWDDICNYALTTGENSDFLNISKFGELYEIGLALVDKNSKKNSGQYYTPDDIASVMGEWLKNVSGYNVCDVACGTGKLILTYLDIIGKKEAIKLISESRLYLYDFDKTALKICKTSLMLKYGIEIGSKIHDVCGDFLDKKINLPKNAKVISNPPYAKIANLNEDWEQTEVQKNTKEFYSAFMEKIFNQADSTVIITPFSFISGNKYKTLRYQMCKSGSGFIVSFDNVPIYL